MKKLFTRYKFDNLIFIFIAGLLVGLVLIQTNPNITLPGRDSGFFLYAGQQLLAGKIAYIDFWDSKGPAIFYTNALGLWLASGSRWGIWLLEYLCLTIAEFVFIKGIIKKCGLLVALIASAGWLYGLNKVLQGGNLTEEYALLFNFFILAYFISIISPLNSDTLLNNTGSNNPISPTPSITKLTLLESDFFPGRMFYFFLGLTFGFSFLFRANNTGIQISLLITLILYSIFRKSYKEALSLLVWSGAGLGLILLIVGVFFTHIHTFIPMINASILYNFIYSNASHYSRWNYKYGIAQIGWPALLAVAGYLVTIFHFFNHWYRTRNLDIIAIFVLIGFPIEVTLSSMSGKGYTHYYISWLPIIALLIAIFFADLLQFIHSTYRLKTIRLTHYGKLITFVFLIIVYFYSGAFSQYKDLTISVWNNGFVENEKTISIATFIKTHTTSADTIFTWGAYPTFNYLARRNSPTPYLFFPAYEKSADSDRISMAFLEDLTSHPPKYIIDAYKSSYDYVLSLDPNERPAQLRAHRDTIYLPPNQKEIFSFISSHYKFIGTLNQYNIYEFITNSN